MQTKSVEIRDRHTFIPAVAVLMHAATPAQRRLFGRAGYSPDFDLVLLIRLTDLSVEYSPHAWLGNRTMAIAHRWIAERWDEVTDGAIVDVEYLAGEVMAPRVSEGTSHEPDAGIRSP